MTVKTAQRNMPKIKADTMKRNKNALILNPKLENQAEEMFT